MLMHTFSFLAIFCLGVLSGCSSITIGQTEYRKQPDPLENYFKYFHTYENVLGPLGKAKDGEIEIIHDRQKIAEIEKTTGRIVGVVGDDKYWLWLNDAVQFPNKSYGVYGRLLWKSSLSGRAGVVVMPVLPNGKIALNRNFRHATRSWEYELPRGAREPNETIEMAAKREAKEETGMIVEELVLLGEMTVDSGTLNTIAPIFRAKVVAQENSTPEDSEAIASIDAFSVAELKQGFVDGYLIKEIKGHKQKIPLRDPFLAYALFMSDITKGKR
ncbi:MAG: NUDIX hydrolase [Alphaproteobacteria bacterium]